MNSSLPLTFAPAPENIIRQLDREVNDDFKILPLCFPMTLYRCSHLKIFSSSCGRCTFECSTCHIYYSNAKPVCTYSSKKFNEILEEKRKELAFLKRVKTDLPLRGVERSSFVTQIFDSLKNETLSIGEFLPRYVLMSSYCEI